MERDEFVSKTKELIARNRLEKAINEMKEYLRDTDKSLYNKVLLQQSKFINMNEQISVGLLTAMDINMTKAQINNALFVILDSLESIPQEEKQQASIFISYNHKQPDETIANAFYTQLKKAGHEVFLASKEIRIGENWQQRIQTALDKAEYFIVLLSKESLLSEMVTEEIKVAHEQNSKGQLIIFPIRINLPMHIKVNYDIAGYLDKIQQRMWDNDKDTQQIVDEIIDVIKSGKSQPLEHHVSQISNTEKTDSMPTPSATLVFTGGAVAVDSPFYIERGDEADFIHSIEHPGALLRIFAPRQFGKTSLLARVIRYAKKTGHVVVPLSLQQFDTDTIDDLDTLLEELCISATDELGMDDKIDDYLGRRGSIQRNCQRYFERYLLKESKKPLFLAFDEADRIFEFPEVSNDFFGMLRAWHERSKDVEIWQNCKIAVSHSTEAYLAIKNMNQSPFSNVGIEARLEEFSVDEVKTFAQRFELNFSGDQIAALMEMVGGHPYLVHKALYLIANKEYDLEKLLNDAPKDNGPYGDHLRRNFWNLSQNPEHVKTMKDIVKTSGSDNVMACSKLRAAGLVKGAIPDVNPSFKLYQLYFFDKLK